MATEPDQIRNEIEMTRADLATNVDRLADKTVPSRIAQRAKNRFSDRMHSMRDRVFGAPSYGNGVRQAGESVRHAAGRAGEAVEGAASQAADAVREAPRMAADKARGNPMAAGLIAFGAGLLAAALIPESDAERRAAQRLADSDIVDQLREPLAESAGRVREDVSESVRESGREVARSAKEAAQSTTEEAKDAAERVRQEQAARSRS
ncbi:MAG TPA: DUF3618 domain-containing protein [Micromonosporaceae bacterium]|nr:DUF3618 domain-containing protein [Micromonosporaceae bacterium]